MLPAEEREMLLELPGDHQRALRIAGIEEGLRESLSGPFSSLSRLASGQSAELLAAEKGIRASVIDLRSVQPLDRKAVCEAVGESGRLLGVDEDSRRERARRAGVLLADLAELGYTESARERVLRLAAHVRVDLIAGAVSGTMNMAGNLGSAATAIIPVATGAGRFRSVSADRERPEPAETSSQVSSVSTRFRDRVPRRTELNAATETRDCNSGCPRPNTDS